MNFEYLNYVNGGGTQNKMLPHDLRVLSDNTCSYVHWWYPKVVAPSEHASILSFIMCHDINYHGQMNFNQKGVMKLHTHKKETTSIKFVSATTKKFFISRPAEESSRSE